MPVFTFTDQNTGAEIKLEANSADEAQSLMGSAAPDAVERAISASNPKAGLTPRDVTAMLGGQGYKAETSGGVNKALVGAGRTFDSWKNGFKQMTGDAASATKDEADARALFAQIDNEGFGAEDLGEALPEVLAMFGGGSVGAGLKTLVASGAIGGALGAVRGTVADGERGLNTVIGAVAPMLGLGAGKLASLGVDKSRAGLQYLASVLYAAKGNHAAAASLAARGLSASSAAQHAADAAVEASIKATGAAAPGARTAQYVATKAQDELAKIIGAMEGDPAAEVAKGVANKAFDDAFSANAGRLALDPAALTNRLARVVPKQLDKLGLVGQRLATFKEFAGKLMQVEDADPASVKAVLVHVMEDPAAEKLARLIARQANNKGVQKSLFDMLKRSAASAAAGVPAATVNASEVTQP